MKDIPVTNNGKTSLDVAGSTVLPGETRIFPEHHVPPHLRPVESEAEPVEVDPYESIKFLLEGNVGSVKEALVFLSDEDLDAIELCESTEGGGKNRAGVTAAITEARLQRAKDADLETFKESLVGLDSDGLTEKLNEINGDLDRQALIDAAIEALPESNG